MRTSNNVRANGQSKKNQDRRQWHQQQPNQNQQEHRNPNEQGQPQQAQGQPGEIQKPKKTKRSTALKPSHFQNPSKGLQKLYKLTNQTNWQQSMSTQSAMNLVVTTIKTWQTQLLPKYYYEYFLQRCQALGSNKEVAAYMNKMRRMHKGLQPWQSENNNPNNHPTADNNNNKNKQGQSEKEGSLDLGDNDFVGGQYSNYQDDANQMEKFRQKAQLAKKLGEQYPPAPAMLTKKSQNMSNNNGHDKEIDDIMDEDLRMFEEMNRRRNNPVKNKPNDREEDEDGFDLGGESGVVFEDGYYDDDD